MGNRAPGSSPGERGHLGWASCPTRRPPGAGWGRSEPAGGGTCAGHVTPGPEALAQRPPSDRVRGSSFEGSWRSRGSLQCRAPLLRRHGLDQVPAVPGRAHARHRLHQHALSKVSSCPAGRGGGEEGALPGLPQPKRALATPAHLHRPTPLLSPSQLHPLVQFLPSVHLVYVPSKGCEACRTAERIHAPIWRTRTPALTRCVPDPDESPYASAPQFAHL